MQVPAPSLAPIQSVSEPDVKRGARWWLKSKTLYGVAILIATLVLSKVRGHAVAPDDAAALDLADALLSLIGAGLAIWGRADVQARLGAAGEELYEMTIPYSALLGPDANGVIREAQAADELPRRADGSIDYGMLPEVVRGPGPLAPGFVTWPLLLVLALLGLLGLALAVLSGSDVETGGGASAAREPHKLKDEISSPSPRIQFRTTTPVPLRSPADVPESWRQPLHHEGRVIPPIWEVAAR